MTCRECGEPIDPVCGPGFTTTWPDAAPGSIEEDADLRDGAFVDQSTCVCRECQRAADAKDDNGYGTGLKW